MTPTPDITVVIPARNAATTIAEQIAALRDQYDHTFEVVLVDNASTDGTAEVARAASSLMPLTILHESRLGANVARNTGIAHASTEKILLCDSDDVVGGTWVKELGRRLEPGYWVSGRIDFELLNSRHTRSLRQRQSTHLGAGVVETWGCNCGFMKSDWSSIGGFDERIHSWGDETEFFQRLSEADKRGIAVSDAVVHYRLRPGWKNLVRDQFRFAIAHERMVNLTLTGGWVSTNRPLGRAARVMAHSAMLIMTFWSLSRRARHLSGIAYHLGRLVGIRHRIEVGGVGPSAEIQDRSHPRRASGN